MRSTFLLLLAITFTNFTFSQDLPSGEENITKCSRAHRSVSGINQIQYYQYPSMNKYDQKFLRLSIAAEPGSRNISGNVYMETVATQSVDTFIIELLTSITVDSVFINGSRLTFSQSNDHIFIRLNTPIAAGGNIRPQIYYHGAAGSVGFYTGTTGSLTYSATESESYQAREWYPAKQMLTDKLDSVEMWITTSIGNKAGSNGLLVDSVDVGGGKRQFKWKTRFAMNYYMPSIAVGNYQEYRNYAKPAAIAPDSILIQNYITNTSSYLSANKTNIDKTPAFLVKFSELFGIYPFWREKYGHCQASIPGGMEHQTMSTMQSFGSTTIAHELGHQWFGDNVTCASWNHIWINEGFASYSEYLAIEKLPSLFTTTTAASFMQSVHDNVMSVTNGSVYVPDASVYDENRIFSNRLSYNKGSAIIHNLRFEMGGDTAFFNSLKNFQQQYKNSTATAENFRQVAETACGKNLTTFFNQWYYGEGYPTFNINYVRQGTDTLVLQINETVSAPTITSFFKGLLELKITSGQGDTTIIVNLDRNDQQFKIGYKKLPTGIVVDPNNWMLNKTGLIIYGGTVPITLFGLEATANRNCIANIKWNIANENTGTSYNIESSSDGTNFSKLSTIAGVNKTTYNFSFPLLQTITYIRIRIDQPNGTSVYSNQIALRNTCLPNYSLELSPNPASTIIRLLVQMPSSEKNILTIIDEKGELLFKKEEVLNKGRNNIILNVRNYAKGTYIIKSENSAGIITKRFVKM